MSVAWTITPPGGGAAVPLENVGLSMVSGVFRTQAADELSLAADGSPFDRSDWYAYDEIVTVYREGTPWFVGRCKERPREGDGGGERVSVRLAGPWADLEEITYQELWKKGPGPEPVDVYTPFVVLGQGPDGEYENTGATVARVLEFAAVNGGFFAVGDVPDGVRLWPSEACNITCAEAIYQTLRWHPDWVTWVDHSTVPLPTIHVTPRGSLSALSFPVDGTGEVASVSIADRADLVPRSVRLLYQTSHNIDGEVVRDIRQDLYPNEEDPPTPTSGRGVVTAIIDLAGAQMQFQKSRIQTRLLATNKEEAKQYLKKKYASLKDIPDAAFTVTRWERKLLPDEDSSDHAPPINPKATRLGVTELEDLPRELVRGSIEDWMRVKVGTVEIECKLKVNSSATAEERKALEAINSMAKFSVVATNATTKVYKGVTQWMPAEDAPANLAQTTYESLRILQYQGSVVLASEDVTATRYHGRKLNLTGSANVEWSSMGAMVSEVSFDLDTGTVSLSVGPAEYLSPADYVELQRMVRRRPPTWWSKKERSSNLFGAEEDPGSRGDTVDGYDIPETRHYYDVSSSGGRFDFWIGGENDDRLCIGPGTISYCGIDDPMSGEPGIVTPMYPTVDGESIGLGTEAPSFSVAGKANASLWLVHSAVDGGWCGDTTIPLPPGESGPERIELTDRDESPEIEEGEIAALIASMDFETTDDGGQQITNVDRRIASDVRHYFSCDDDSSSSSDSMGSSDGSSDSDSDPDPPNPSSDSSSSDDVVTTVPTPCCPVITLNGPECTWVEDYEGIPGLEPYCFSTGGELLTAGVVVSGYVNPPANCSDCEGRLWVEYGLRDVMPRDPGRPELLRKTAYLGGSMSGHFGDEFFVLSMACQQIEAYARIFVTGGIGSCELDSTCEVTVPFTMPPVCAGGPCE